jgi:plasmid stabilization system protein ParE
MNFPVVVRPEAEQDLLAARDWYDQQRVGLGDEFSTQVSAILDRLSAMPELFAVRWHDVRSCRLRQFPYIVYYRALSDRVEVLAVLHVSRDSSAWQSRT